MTGSLFRTCSKYLLSVRSNVQLAWLVDLLIPPPETKTKRRRLVRSTWLLSSKHIARQDKTTQLSTRGRRKPRTPAGGTQTKSHCICQTGSRTRYAFHSLACKQISSAMHAADRYVRACMQDKLLLQARFASAAMSLQDMQHTPPYPSRVALVDSLLWPPCLEFHFATLFDRSPWPPRRPL